ncbi:MAG: D-tyrosyl-tRNA(Tyr) deacylase [Thermoprotei archaeon]|nr:MAG: D-tyrosyl-tRNA(Tyr) deacylase [Thermoprotei archaeon]
MATPFIAYSVNDLAGRGIARALTSLCEAESTGGEILLKCRGFTAVMRGFEADVIEFEFLDSAAPDASFHLVLSRHSSRSAIKTLSTHHPGNPGPRNDAGGRPYELPPANPVLAWLLLNELRRTSSEEGLTDFDITYEVTHHGPTSVRKSITFVEIGSTESEWRFEKAHRAVAKAVVNALARLDVERPRCVVAVGFGGNHYAPRFTSRALSKGECYGHMVPAYVLRNLSDADVRRVAELAINATPGVQRVVIEKKLRSGIRRAIKEVAQSLGLEVLEV